MWKYNYSSELYHAKRGRPKGSRIVNGKVIPPAGWSPVEKEKKEQVFRNGPTDKVQPKYGIVSVGNTSLQPINKVQPKYGIVSVGNTGLQKIQSTKQDEVQPKYGIVSIGNMDLQEIQSTKQYEIGKRLFDDKIETFTPGSDDIIDPERHRTEYEERARRTVDDVIDADFTEENSNNSQRHQNNRNDPNNRNNRPRGSGGPNNPPDDPPDDPPNNRNNRNNRPGGPGGSGGPGGPGGPGNPPRNQQNDQPSNQSNNSNRTNDINELSAERDKQVISRRAADVLRYDRASKSLDDAGNRLSSGADIVNKISVQEREKMDLSGLSNDELRKQIDRYDLEARYNERFASPTKAARGKRVLSNILYGAGVGAKVSGSIASMLASMRSIKKLDFDD